eukprot:6966148-Prymnesium_polylepis.1
MAALGHVGVRLDPLKRDWSCRRSQIGLAGRWAAWRRGWMLVPSDAGRALFWWWAVAWVPHNLGPLPPNCGCCGLKERVSWLLRKRGFAEARPWGIAHPLRPQALSGSICKDVQLGHTIKKPSH